MTKLSAVIITVVAFFSFVSIASAAAPDECPAIVPVENLNSLVGDSVTVYTVFKGTEIESFPAEIAGIGENQWLPGSSIVWAIASGPKIDAIDGVAQGMSGSPVYTESGQLIGALAYGLTPNGRIFGITPADEMTKALDRSLLGEAAGPIRSISSPYGKMKPLSTGLSTSATGPFAEVLKNKLKRFGVSLKTGVNTSSPLSVTPTPGASFEEGGSLFAMLTTGRFTTGATGTTTYVCDGDVLGFGHPFTGMPSMRAILSNGTIYDVLKSGGAWNAFKFGTATDPVGSLTADTRFGIAGKIGQATDTASISGTVGDYTGPISEIVQIPVSNRDSLASITPDLFATALDQEIAATTIYDSENISTSGSYKISGTTSSGPFRATKPFSAWSGSSRSDPGFGFFLGGSPLTLLNDLNILYKLGISKPSTDLKIDSVEVNIAAEKEIKKYTIVGKKLRVGKGRWLSEKGLVKKSIKKGQVLSVRLNLLSASGQTKTRVLRYRVLNPKGSLSLYNFPSGEIIEQGGFTIIEINTEIQKTPKNISEAVKAITKPEGVKLTEKLKGLKRIAGSLSFDRVIAGEENVFLPGPKKNKKNK